MVNYKKKETSAIAPQYECITDNYRISIRGRLQYDKLTAKEQPTGKPYGIIENPRGKLILDVENFEELAMNLTKVAEKLNKSQISK